MSVEPEISRRIVKEELQAMAPLIKSYRWKVSSKSQDLIVVVKMKSSIDGEIYIIEAQCDNYKALPPMFEFIHPKTGERGLKRCYPADGSYFHAMPCICVQWNRKAYQVNNGPHSDWEMANWITYRPGMTTLGDMFNLIQLQINNKQKYKGRMET